MNDICPVFGEDCLEKNHEKCKNLFSKYCKIIFCNDAKCLWNQQIDIKKFVKRHKDHKPFPHDFYSGVCSRPEIAINPKVIDTREVKHQLAVCAVRSNKGISGHLDWSRYPQGGNIPDPVDPGTAYH